MSQRTCQHVIDVFDARRVDGNGVIRIVELKLPRGESRRRFRVQSSGEVVQQVSELVFKVRPLDEMCYVVTKVLESSVTPCRN